MTSEASIPEPPNVFIYNKDTTKDAMLNNVTHVKVDPSVKVIGRSAFERCLSFVEVEFSEGLEVIGKRAFWICTNLKHINKLPSTLKEIGDNAFLRCESLDSIEFPEGLQVIGAFAFAKCFELKRIKIPSAHVVIKSAAFQGCSGLDSVELPEGLQVIGECWFYGCWSLTTVNVPSSVIEIHSGAFLECASLASLDLPEGLQSIGARSFAYCKSLATLHIPSTVCKMGNHVFRDCTGLRSITLPDALEIIGDEMFYKCTSLTHIEIPSKVTKIGDQAFRSCEGLKHLRIPSSVTRIERGAFAQCTRLISLELPEGLETIDLNALHGCVSLVNLVIPLEQDFEQYDGDEIMQGLKLRHVAGNFDDLVSKLQHRFDDLPVHRLCYYQSYYPLMEAMENLRQTIYANPAAGNKVDSFGMTPFHILALSQTPKLSLFQGLLEVYQVDVIHTRDKFGSTPIDYLCMNHIPGSAFVIRSLLPTIIVQRLRWLGLARWKSDMLVAMDEALATEWESRRREIRLLYFKLATYERLESVSLLELALWKVKIEECRSKRPRLDRSHLDGVDRQSCRIKSGADVVISNVLPFLDKVCREDYYSDD